MDTELARSRKNLRRTESKWGDHHISHKNSKWLENNLEDMDRRMKRMMKLIEEDADSLTKKAEMYFRRRPELISLVEEFYRMYRSLAERYDNITGELRKGSSSDLQSQSSSGRRGVGFDFFLGPGGSNSDVYQREGDESPCMTDSELESDDSSVNTYTGSVSSACDPQALNRRVVELEFELREAKEKLRMHHEGDIESLFRRVKSERKFDDLPATVAAYEQELRDANERIQTSEEEIKRLQNELSGIISAAEDEGTEVLEEEEGATSQDPDLKIQALTEALRVTRVRLQDAEERIAILKQELDNKSKTTDQKLKSLHDEFESARKEAATWKNKSNTDRREVVKLQDRVSMLKSSLAGRDHEIRDLKVAVADAEEKIFPEKAQIKAEISKLLEERKVQEEEMKELETRVRCLENEIRSVTNEKREAEERMQSEMSEKESCIESMSKRVSELESERDILESERDKLKEEIVGLKSEVSGTAKRMEEMEEEMERQRKKTEEVAEEKREVIRQLCFSLDHLRDEFMGLRRAFAGHRPRTLPILAA